MSVTILVENAMSRVTGDPETLARLRKLIAWRAVDLPPINAQAIVRRFRTRFRGGRYTNTREELQALWTSQEGLELVDLGWGPEQLTDQMYRSVIKQHGGWDGWETLITTTGWFGTGLLPHVCRALRLRLEVEPVMDDRRVQPNPGTLVGVAPEPYEHQEEAVEAWWAAGGRGVVDLPPRSGKTIIAILLARRLGLPTLVVVPTIELVKQTVAAFRAWLPDEEVIGLTGGKPNAKTRRQMIHAMVWIATPGTAAGPKPAKKGERRKGIAGIRTRQFLVIDEFHHAAADTYQDISRAATNAYYRLGLTGTHYRADGKDMIMRSVLSRSVYSRSVQDMIEADRLADARVCMLRLRSWCPLGPDERIQDAGIVDNDARNLALARAAQWLVSHDKRVLILVRIVRHGESLQKLIPGSVFVDGRDNSRVRPALEALEAKHIRCVIGTSVIGEGVDVPAADAMVYAPGGRSKVKVIQDTFRVLTVSEGKTHGVIIDCADDHHDTLTSAAAQRLGLYRKQGFHVDVIDGDQLPGWLESVEGRAL